MPRRLFTPTYKRWDNDQSIIHPQSWLLGHSDRKLVISCRGCSMARTFNTCLVDVLSVWNDPNKPYPDRRALLSWLRIFLIKENQRF